jgi:hypothetical protein
LDPGLPKTELEPGLIFRTGTQIRFQVPFLHVELELELESNRSRIYVKLELEFLHKSQELAKTGHKSQQVWVRHSTPTGLSSILLSGLP